MDIQYLKAKAEKAGGEEWKVDNISPYRVEDIGGLLICDTGKWSIDYKESKLLAKRAKAEAEYIAAANPAAVLELLARLEAVEADAERMKEKVKEWEAFNQPLIDLGGNQSDDVHNEAGDA